MQIYTQEFPKYRDVIIKKTCRFHESHVDIQRYAMQTIKNLLSINSWFVGCFTQPASWRACRFSTHVSHCVSEKSTYTSPSRKALPNHPFPFVSRTCAKPLKPGRLNRSISISWKKRCRTPRSRRRRSTAAGTASDSAAKSCRRS